jgi:hypothetical protein
MLYFFDTEFYESGDRLQLISIGVVAEDGREFYAIADLPSWNVNDWLRENVYTRLQPKHYPIAHPHEQGVIRNDLLAFIGDDPDVRFMAYYGAYDWVALCKIMGGMMALPEGWYWICRELRTELDLAGHATVKDDGRGDEHNALADARWVRHAYRTYLQAPPSGGEAQR